MTSHEGNSPILCFVDHVSRYIRVMKTNLMHYLWSVYFVNQLLYVSGIFLARHQEVYCVYTTNMYVLCFLVDCLLAGQQAAKHVEVDWQNRLRINSTSSWFSLHGDIPLVRRKDRCHDNTKMDHNELCGFFQLCHGTNREVGFYEHGSDSKSIRSG